MATDSKDDKLVIEIELDDGKLAKGFVNAKDVAGKEGKKAGKDFGDGASQAAQNGLKNLKASIAGVVLTLASAFAAREVIEAAKIQENAVNEINTALKLSGQYTRQASEDFQEFASTLQKNSRIGDEVVLQNAALIQNLGKLNKEALKPATQAALDMAEALNIDLRSAATLVGKAAAGEISSFTRYGVIIEKGATQAKTFANTLKALQEQFGGAAAAKLLTYDGAFSQLKNTFGDLLESVGFYITKSPLVIATFKVLNEEITGVSANLNKLGTADTMLNISRVAIEVGKALNTYLIAPIELFYNLSKVVFNSFTLTLQTVVAGVADLFGKMANIANYFGVDNDLTRSIQNFAASTSEVWDEMAQDTQKSIDDIFDFSVADKSEQFIDRIAAVTEQVAAANAAAVEQSSQAMKKSKVEISKTTKDITNMITNGLVRGVSTGIQAVGASFVQGGGAFKDFGNQIIGIMGDLAIQVGTAILVTGQAIEVLRASILTAVGIPAIAAGIALVALGGALKAFAAKNSATAQSNSAVPQTGGDSYGTQQQDQSVITQPQTQQEKNPEINIVVQGDIIDSQDTGRRLVDLINTAFDKEGVKIKRGAIA